MTVLDRVPIPSICTSTLSPGTIGPMPAGVPVVMISPGFKVMMFETNRTKKGTEKIRSRVFPDCFSFPFKKVLILSLAGSMSVAIQGPMEANVSKDFARVN